MTAAAGVPALSQLRHLELLAVAQSRTDSGGSIDLRLATLSRDRLIEWIRRNPR
jgi:hypothetical protein